MKTLISFAFALILPLAAPLGVQAQSNDGSPEGLVRQVTNDVLDAIKSDAGLQAGDKQKALRLPSRKCFRTSISPK